MKIGILQCDSVRPQFQAAHGDYPVMIELLFRQVMPAASFSRYDVTVGHYPNEIDECDVYVTTGSKASVYDGHAWIGALQAFVTQLCDREKKLIAICFGHQLIAQAFGGAVMKSDKGWGVGVHTMQVVEQKPWMVPPLNQCSVLVSHQDQVVKLPRGAVLIAGSDFCPHAMFQLGKSVLSIQGHPEFTKPYARDLMDFRRELLGESCYQTGLNSLQGLTDEFTIARWMAAFINYG